jgi:hypothetical protein
LRWETWPALLATLAWAWFLVAGVAGSRAGGLADVVAPFALAVIPLALSARALVRDWLSASSHGTAPQPVAQVPRSWLLRLVASALLALVLSGVGFELLRTALSSSFDVGLEAPVTVRRLMPGPSETWAYLVGLAATVVAVATDRRAGLIAAVAAALGAIGGGALLAWQASAIAPPIGSADGSCRDSFTVPRYVVRSAATGELDGSPLGTVDLRPSAEMPSELAVRFDTRWGVGRSVLPAPTTTSRDPLEEVTNSRDAQAIVDDLGVDVLAAGNRTLAARHCRLAVDGPSGIASFPALRWLVEGDERATEPVPGLEAWRGTLDYWLVTTTEERFGDIDLILATVAVDGQPRAWRFPGLHASVRAASWFGEPSPGPRITDRNARAFQATGGGAAMRPWRTVGARSAAQWNAGAFRIDVEMPGRIS